MGCNGMRLFGGFELRLDGEVVEVPSAAHRLLGFLGLRHRQLPRAYVAESLWPDTNDEKAHANLRTALWRLRGLSRDVLAVTAGEVGLVPSFPVDVQLLEDAARQYRRSRVLPDPEVLLELRGELLPGCWDDWVIFDRECLRQEAVHLLEHSSRDALARGDEHLALMLGLRAVECDPLRESVNLMTIRMRLAGGDVPGAVRHARSYARLLQEEVGVSPPSSLAPLLSASAGRPVAVDSHGGAVLAGP